MNDVMVTETMTATTAQIRMNTLTEATNDVMMTETMNDVTMIKTMTDEMMSDVMT